MGQAIFVEHQLAGNPKLLLHRAAAELFGLHAGGGQLRWRHNQVGQGFKRRLRLADGLVFSRWGAAPRRHRGRKPPPAQQHTGGQQPGRTRSEESPLAQSPPKRRGTGWAVHRLFPLWKRRAKNRLALERSGLEARCFRGRQGLSGPENTVTEYNPHAVPGPVNATEFAVPPGCLRRWVSSQRALFHRCRKHASLQALARDGGRRGSLTARIGVCSRTGAEVPRASRTAHAASRL